MSIYLFATIEVTAGRFAEFTAVMGKLKSLTEEAGWKLHGAFVQKTGQLNTVIDIWELRDYSHIQSGFASIAAHPGFADISATLQSVIARETLTIADSLVYPSAS